MKLTKQDISYLKDEYEDEFYILTERKNFPRKIDDLDVEIFIKSLTKEKDIIKYVVDFLLPYLKDQLQKTFVNYKENRIRDIVEDYIDNFLDIHMYNNPKGFEFANDLLNKNPKYYVELENGNEAIIFNNNYTFVIDDQFENLDELLINYPMDIKDELIKKLFC